MTDGADRGRSGELTGWIFDIKRFAVHDGPGIRTTVFFKGCGLRCAWCHNPEAISPRPELAVFPQKCIGCGMCLEVCPEDAHEVGDGAAGGRVFHRGRCRLCGACVEVCYAEALMMQGREIGVEEALAELRKDAAFYANSTDGGVTLSGGEPLMQAAFALALLRGCKAEGFHTAVDTCGQVGWETIEEILPFVDLWLYDFKHPEPEEHRRLTGASNDRILANLRRLSEQGASIEIRMPIVPTVNDSRESIDLAAEFLAGLANAPAVRLLPYHRLGASKYERLDLEETMPEVEPPSPERLREIAARLEGRGLRVVS
jgi:pyruvate formate lyase activating enzyme